MQSFLTIKKLRLIKELPFLRSFTLKIDVNPFHLCKSVANTIWVLNALHKSIPVAYTIHSLSLGEGWGEEKKPLRQAQCDNVYLD